MRIRLFLTTVVLALPLFGAVSPARAQTVAEFRNAMQAMGCGAEFDAAVQSNFTHNLRYEHVNQFPERHHSRLTGLMPGPLERAPKEFTPDALLRSQLLNYSNYVDQLQGAQLLAEYFRLRDDVRTLTDKTVGGRFQKNASTALLCLIAKRKGISQSQPVVPTLQKIAADMNCAAPLKRLLDLLPPTAELEREIQARQILSGLEGRQVLLDNHLVATGNLPQAARRFVEAIQNEVVIHAQPQPMVPSPHQKTQRDQQVYKASSEVLGKWFWFCVRAKQEGVLDWIAQDPKERTFLLPNLKIAKNQAKQYALVDSSIYMLHVLLIGDDGTPIIEPIFGCAINGRPHRSPRTAPYTDVVFPPCMVYVEGRRPGTHQISPESSCSKLSVGLGDLLLKGNLRAMEYPLPKPEEMKDRAQRLATEPLLCPHS